MLGCNALPNSIKLTPTIVAPAPAVLAGALRPLSLTEDGTAAAILALEYGGLRCAAAAFYPHLINCSPPSEGAVYGKANEGHWFLFSGAIQVGFQGGRKPTLARSLRGCPCFYSTEAIRSFRSIGLISRSEVCPDKTSRRATTATACIATNHTKRDHNYLMRDYGSNVKK